MSDDNIRGAGTSETTEKLPRMRASCDSCTRSKLRCDGAKPSCTRCYDRDDFCVYSRIGRVGRPPRSSTSHPTHASHQDSPRDKASRAVNRRATVHYIPKARESREKEREPLHAEVDHHGPNGIEEGDPKQKDRDEACVSVQTSNLSHPWLLSPHSDEEAIASPRLQHLLTPTSEDTMPVFSSISHSTNRFGTDGSEGRLFQDEEVFLGAYGKQAITPRSAPAGTTRFNADDMNIMNLDFDVVMGPEFDIDAEFLSSPKCTTSNSNLPPEQARLVGGSSSPQNEVGQLEAVWDQIMLVTLELQQMVGSIAPDPSTTMPEKRCPCPTLIGRLQLLAIHPRLAPHRGDGHRRSEHLRHRTLPLDLLVFLDEIVYRTVVGVCSCEVCGHVPRALLTLCLLLDWLVDVLKETLESGVPGLSASSTTTSWEMRSPTSPRDGRGNAFRRAEGPGGATVAGLSSGSDIQHDDSDASELQALRLGAFQLHGELWGVCVRELLKSRLNRLSQLLENRFCKSEGGNLRQHGSDREDHGQGTSIGKALKCLASDIYCKIEFLFGMIELWGT